MLAVGGVPVILGQPGPSPAKSGASDTGNTGSIPVSSTLIQDCTLESFSVLENWQLSAEYNNGQWDPVKERLQKLIGSLKCAGNVRILRGSVSVLFLDVALSPPGLVRVLLQPADVSADPYSLRVSTKKIYDLHLFADARMLATSAYTAKPSPNPLVAAVAKVAGLLSQGLQKAPVSLSRSELLDTDAARRQLPPPKRISVLVYNVQLKEITDRATLTIADVGSLPPLSSAATRADELHTVLDLIEDQANHETARQANDELYNAFKESCSASPPQSTCASALGKAVQGHWPSSAAEIDDIQRMYTMYVGLANASIPMTSTTQYAVAPLTRVDIGLGTGVVLTTSLNRPVKVDSSKNLADDQPTTLLTFAALNYHPGGYDETTILPGGRELFRIFGGISLTPNPGLVVGTGYGVRQLRGLAIVGGFGVLLANVLRSGDTVGIMPRNPGSPSRRGAMGILFVGVGYTLQ